MGTETLFWICAILGSGFFLSKVVLALVFGLGEHHPSDVNLHDASGTEGAFKVFSFYSISAFLMMFGWTGLAVLHQGGAGGSVALMVGLLVGVVMMLGTAKFFSVMMKLTSSGSTFSVEKTKGLTGSVYQRIPGGEGHGVVQVTVEGISREIEAVSDAPLDSFTSVEVIGVRDPKTVIVKKIG